MLRNYRLLLFLTILLPARAGADEILVSAAASLTEAFTEIGRAYSRVHSNTTVSFNFGASGALQRQIEQGAPVDVFASASLKEMDALQAGKRLEPGTRVNFASNSLVLIAPRGSKIRSWNELGSAAVRRVAFSDPASVPSGRYAEATLRHRGLWAAVQPKAVMGENVRQTLEYVANGDVDAGIVFATDARVAHGRVRVVAQAVAGRDHQPIIYPAAVVAHGPNGQSARLFVKFLVGPAARHILADHGFVGFSRHARRGGG